MTKGHETPVVTGTDAHRLGGWTCVGVLGVYLASVLVATYPALFLGRSELAVADFTDPLQHLWTLQWYRACIIDGRFPFLCPELQHPVGSPLGLYSPLLLQAILYLGMSVVTTNDVVLYNALLLVQFIFTGFATFLLAWKLIRHRIAATLAGLLAMLSGPMMYNAQMGGTELLSLGGVSLFMVAWMRLVDRPSGGRLAAANASFLVLAAGSPYYAVMTVFPAVLYVFVEAVKRGRQGVVGWIGGQWAWLVGFGTIALVTSPFVLPTQLWAVAQGYPMSRSRTHFEQFHANIWSYVIPPARHRLANEVLPPFWQTPWVQDRVSVYLGVVTVGLLGYGAATRVRFRHSGYLWLCLGVLVLLSMGAYATVGTTRIPLPALWLWEHVSPFRAMRVPARYGYLGAVFAAILAGGAAARLLERTRRKSLRSVIVATLFSLAIADLSTAPFTTQPIPPLPPAYARLLGSDPEASFCEIHPTGYGFDYLRYESTLAYWQASHGGRTSAGNPGVENRVFLSHAQANSPFHYFRLADPEYLSTPGLDGFDLVREARFEDYARLYLDALNYDYLILHKWTWDGTPTPAPLMRIRERLAGAIVDEDDAVVVFDPKRIPLPTRPTALCLTGWRDRVMRFGTYVAVAEQEATILVDNPTPDRPLRLQLIASSYLEPRVVLLHAGDREVARWHFCPESETVAWSPPFFLPEGRHTLRLTSDGSARPLKPKYAPVEGETRPFSLWVSSLHLANDESEPDRIGLVTDHEELRD